MQQDQAPIRETHAEGRKFVTFEVDGGLFGVPLDAVQEIIRMPALVAVPLGPPGLEGIANLRGAILPVTSLRRIFGAGDHPHDDATRVVVVRIGESPAGLVVDRMASVVAAEEHEIEDASAIGATIRSDLLRGVVKRAEGLIQLLEPAQLADRRDRGRRAGTTRARTAAVDEAAMDQPEDDIHLVSFETAGEEYALAIEEVLEIVQLPPAITRTPRAPAHVVGVMTLRERLLPLVSLRRMFGLPEAELGEASRIVVVSPDGDADGSVGVIMDAVKGVLRVPRAVAEPVPALLADGAEGRLEAICRLEEGRRLVTILSARRMFQRSAIDAVVMDDMVKEEAAVSDDGMRAGDPVEEQVVVFRLAGEEYGVPIDAVQEIVRIPDDLTRIPRTPDFIEGVVNLRGAVLPVVDQRRRFALPPQDRNDRQRIMVLSIGGVRTGFIVDQVSEVRKIARAAIAAAPSLSAEQERLIRRVANLQSESRMVLMIDPSSLLDSDEIRALEAA